MDTRQAIDEEISHFIQMEAPQCRSAAELKELDRLMQLGGQNFQSSVQHVMTKMGVPNTCETESQAEFNAKPTFHETGLIGQHSTNQSQT